MSSRFRVTGHFETSAPNDPIGGPRVLLDYNSKYNTYKLCPDAT